MGGSRVRLSRVCLQNKKAALGTGTLLGQNTPLVPFALLGQKDSVPVLDAKDAPDHFGGVFSIYKITNGALVFFCQADFLLLLLFSKFDRMKTKKKEGRQAELFLALLVSVDIRESGRSLLSSPLRCRFSLFSASAFASLLLRLLLSSSTPPGNPVGRGDCRGLLFNDDDHISGVVRIRQTLVGKRRGACKTKKKGWAKTELRKKKKKKTDVERKKRRGSLLLVCASSLQFTTMVGEGGEEVN